MRRKRIQLPLVLGCVFRNNNVLIIKRKEPSIPTLHGKWEFPGGKVNFAESPERAIEHKIFEETGCIEETQSLFPFTYVAVRESKRQDLNALIFCFRTKLIGTSSTRSFPRKAGEVSWLDINELNPIEIQSGTFRFLQYYMSEEGIHLSRNTELIEFPDRDKMLSHLSMLVSRRYRHGYVIIDISDNFRNIPLIDKFQMIKSRTTTRPF